MTVMSAHDDKIREMAKSSTTKEIADELGRNFYDVRNYCKKCGIKTKDSINIEDYDEQIRELAKTKSTRQIGKEIGYSGPYVSKYCKENGIDYKRWQVKDYDDEVRELVKTKNAKEIAEELGFHYTSISAYCKNNSIKFTGPLTIGDYDDQIRELAKTKTVKEIAEEIKYSFNYLNQYMIKNGIKAKGLTRKATAWWKRLDIEVTKETLVSDYHQWWSFVYKKSTVRDVTFEKYRIANGYLRKHLSDVKLKDVTRSVYQGFMNKLGERLSKQTLMDTNNTIKRSLRDAEYEGLIEKDPTYGLQLSGTDNSDTVNKFISQHELDKLLSSLDYGTNLDINDTKSSWIVFLAAKTGFRYGEILGLTVDNFDFDSNEITIDKTLNYKKGAMEFQPTKNKSSMRTVFVDNITMILFKNLIKDFDEELSVFTQDEKRIHNSTVNQYLKEKCEEVSIPKISIHSLRHTHASVLLAGGVSMQTVSKRLGHSDLSTTQNVYSHITDELTKKDSEKINGALSRLGGFQ